jgi:hypothetical protein
LLGHPTGFVKAYGHNGYFTSLKAPIESMTLGTGWRAVRRALRRDHGAVLGIGLTCSAAHLRRRIPGHADVYSARRSNIKETAGDHICTNGPGAFRYWFLIASRAQYVSAPIDRVVIGDVLRKRRGAESEDVRHVPALQIAVDRAGLGSSPMTAPPALWVLW